MQRDPTRPGQNIERFEWHRIDPGELSIGAALEEALAHPGPALVEVVSSSLEV